MSFVSEGDDVWIGDYLGVVTEVSAPFRSGNYLDEDRKPKYGREIVVFIEEDE